MFFLFQYGLTPNRTAPLPAAFLCMGFGFITRQSMVLLIMAASIYLASVLRGSGRLQVERAFGIGILVLSPFLTWQLYYNHLRTGNIFTSPGLTASTLRKSDLTAIYSLA